MIKKGRIGKIVLKDGNPSNFTLKPFENLEIMSIHDQPSDGSHFSIVFLKNYKSGYMSTEAIEWKPEHIFDLPEDLISRTEYAMRYDKETECIEVRPKDKEFDFEAFELLVPGLLEWIKEHHSELFMKAVTGNACVTHLNTPSNT